MSVFLSAIAAVSIISVISLTGAATLSLNQKFMRKILFLLLSLAAGAMLGDAFIHLIPEAFEEVGDTTLVSLFVLGGILSFLIIEKFLHLHHSHGRDEHELDHPKVHPIGRLAIVSDSIHNFVDGLAIGASFLVSPEIGIATTIAIALHEIPQEIGDFGLLIHAGLSRGSALMWNFISALTAFLGLGVAFLIADFSNSVAPLIAAFAAGNFIYIACSDLLPELHKTTSIRNSALQFLTIIVGLGAMVLLIGLE